MSKVLYRGQIASNVEETNSISSLHSHYSAHSVLLSSDSQCSQINNITEYQLSSEKSCDSKH